jgi:Protein of unknown function (DUF3562)
MTMLAPDTPPHASTVHARDLEALAREAHVPFDDVAQLYARELGALTAGARITSFLPILATRKVCALLRQCLHPRLTPAAVEVHTPSQTIPLEDKC